MKAVAEDDADGKAHFEALRSGEWPEQDRFVHATDELLARMGRLVAGRAKGLLGWRERVALPQLGIAILEAKVDTGARTSALHTLEIKACLDGEQDAVRFLLRPDPQRPAFVHRVHAIVKDRRVVRDSGGHEEERYIIETNVRLGEAEWPIEISLTNRDNMAFQMLLGRTAIRGRFTVDPARSYLSERAALAGRPPPPTVRKSPPDRIPSTCPQESA